MIEKLDALGGQAFRDIETASSLEALDHVRVSVLGKKGALSEALKGLGSVGPEEHRLIRPVCQRWWTRPNYYRSSLRRPLRSSSRTTA